MLPPELLLQVSSFLSPEDKCSFALVCTTFSLYVCWSDEERVEKLLAQCAMKNDISTLSFPQRIFDSALEQAAKRDFSSALVLLEDGRANPSSSPGIEHLLFSEVDTIQDLIKLLDDSRLHPRHGVASVVDGGRLEILQHVLDDGRLDPAAEDNLALLFAVRYGDPALVDALQASGKVHASTEKILAAAASRSNAAIFQSLSLPLPLLFEGWPVPRR